jgi:membrane protease YdiL (CAAX protease family)
MLVVVLGAGLFVFLFNIIGFAGLLMMPPTAGILWSAFLGTLFLLWQLRNDEGRRKRFALLRLRPVRASRRWQLTAVGSSLLLIWGMAGVISWLGPSLDPESLQNWEPLTRYIRRPGGWLAVAVLTAFAVPLVEEMAFRGYIQHTLERRWGPAPAIGVATLLFTIAHLGRPHWAILLIPLTLGLVNGMVTWLARSIWPAVVIHACWNLLMTLGGRARAPTVELEDMAAVGLSLSVLALALGVLGWVRLLRGGRRAVWASAQTAAAGP